MSEVPIASLEVVDDAAGAVVEFRGVVRNHDGGRAVDGITYEGHPDAGRIVREIVAEVGSREGVHAAAAVHRVGDLVVGDVAFLAAVGASHRREAFEACAFLVDEVKRRLPVWKHQHFSDGTSEWSACP